MREQSLAIGPILDGRYQIIEFIVFGSHAEIYEILGQDNENYILKYYPWRKIKQYIGRLNITRARTRIDNEIKYQSSLCHQNIIQIIECNQTDTEIFIVMEKATGYKIGREVVVHDFFELLDVYHSLNRFLSIDEVTKYFAQIVEGVKYLHEHGIVHGDLKTENILLSNGVAKIADFDWSRPLKTTVDSLDLRNPSNGSGTLIYCPPELLWQNIETLDFYKWNKSFYSSTIDVWCLGLILYEFLTSGCSPYLCSLSGLNPLCTKLDEHSKKYWSTTSLYKMQEHFLDHLDDEPIYDTNVPEEARDLVRRLLCRNPDKRITVSEIIGHQFMN